MKNRLTGEEEWWKKERRLEADAQAVVKGLEGDDHVGVYLCLPVWSLPLLNLLWLVVTSLHFCSISEEPHYSLLIRLTKKSCTRWC